MGRKSVTKDRKAITPKVNKWLSVLLHDIQGQDLKILTMDDLVRISGKSKSTFYTYFESKEEVLQAACQTRVQSIFDQLQKVDVLSKDVSQIYSKYIEIFAKGTAGIRLDFLQSIRKYYPVVWNQIEFLTDTFVDLLRDLYVRGIEMDIYTNISVELLTAMDKMFVVEMVTNPELFSDDKYSISDLVRDYLKLRLNGLLVRD